MGIKHKSIVLFLVLFSLVKVVGQEKDFQLRTAVSVGSDLYLGFDGSVELQQRFKENLSMYDRTLLTFNLGHGIAKGLKAELGYRIVVLKDPELNFRNKYRLTGDLRYKTQVLDFEIKFRSRLQYGYDENLHASNYLDNKLVNRNLLSVNYHIPQTRLTPYLNYEMFLNLKQPEFRRYYKSRLVGGCKVKLSKDSDLDFYYMFEDEFNVSNPLDSYILGLSWDYSF